MVLMLSFDRGYLGLLDFGHGTAALQNLVAANDDRKKRVARALRRRYFLFSLFGIVVIIGIGRVILGSVAREQPASALWILALIMCIRIPIDMQHAANVVLLESQSDYQRIRTIELLGNLTWLGIAIIALQSGISVRLAALSYLLIGLMQLLLSRFALRASLDESGSSGTEQYDDPIELWKNGKWVAMQRASGVVYWHMDRLIIAFAVGLHGVGEYEIPYKIQALGVLLLSTLPSAVFPFAAKLKSDSNQSALVDLYHRGTRLSVAICVPPLLALVLLARPLVDIWVGSKYLHLVHSVQLFTSWTFLAVFHVIGTMMFAAIGRNRENFILSTGAVAINLPLSIWLGSVWGVDGVITGTLVGYGIIFVPSLILEQRLFGDGLQRWFREVILPMLVPVVTEIGLLVWLRTFLDVQNQVLLTPLFGSVGVISTWIVYFRFFAAKEDNEIIRSLLTSRR